MTDDQPPRTRRETLSGARKQLYLAAAGLLVALSTAIPALVQSCAAKQTAEKAEERSERGEVAARSAKVEAVKAKTEATAGYAVTKEKLDATAEVAADAATACATKAEIADLHRRIDALPLAGRRPRRGRRRPGVVVPPEVKEPLPPTPAAAAAEQKDK